MAYKQLKLWFNRDLVELLANKVKASEIKFDKEAFIHSATQGLDDLELKGRIEQIADVMNLLLPFNYEKSATLLVSILGPENQKETGMFKEYYWVMPIAKYVEKYGLENFETSMKAIYEITKRNTGEYTIRPFLEKYQENTLEKMLAWSKNPNKHVRRLASEGLRPRLPWASKLDSFILDPSPILPILENLKDDPSKYVQKSVANCINDVLKDNPEVGKALIQNWMLKPTEERKWIIKHALRNPLKAKDSWALKIVEQ